MLSNKIITKTKLHQIINAGNLRQAFQILNTADIGVGVDPEDYEQALAYELSKTYEIVREVTNGLELFDILRFKYDGLNIKFVLKHKVANSDNSNPVSSSPVSSKNTPTKIATSNAVSPNPFPLHSMSTLGTVRREDIIKGINNIESISKTENTDSTASITNNTTNITTTTTTAKNSTAIPGLPPELSQAAVEAWQVLTIHRDPQKADIVIDKAVLAAQHRIAFEYDNKFFQKVVCSRIDIENIKSLLRAKQAGKDIKTLESLLIKGGYIGTDKYIKILNANIRDIAAFIRNTRYGYALESGLGDVEANSRLTHFEKVCDNFLLTFISEANRVVFGIEPILGYILEKENEITSIRLVMAAKMAGNPANTIIERLREHAG